MCNIGRTNAKVLPEPVWARRKVSWEVPNKCGIASCWISVGWEMESVLDRWEEIVELIPREVKVVAVSDGAFVGCEGAVVGWFSFGGDIISGLLVNREEEGNVRGATGVALAEVVLVLFRFRFNGRDGTVSIFSVLSVCTLLV